MKAKRLILICAAVVLLVPALLLLTCHRPSKVATEKQGDWASPTQAQHAEVTQTQHMEITRAQYMEIKPVSSNASPLEFPEDPRPEVQQLYKLAKAGNFYGFNPEIVYRKTNDRPRQIDLGTPTHGASVSRGIVFLAYSYVDGSDVRRKPEAAKDWYLCTGKWTEKEAIAETLHILERLGETSVLAKLTEDRHECEAVEMRVVTQLGETVKVTPFYNVRLSDKQGRCIVQAEYRMGTNGPAGVTRWYFWP